MSYCWKPSVACLTLLALAVACGCGHSDSGQPPKASVPGTGDTAPSTGASAAATPQTPTVDAQHPKVLIETSLGNITVQLDRKNAPLSVYNFLMYTNASFYDKTIVHQVYKGQAILAGGYDTIMAAKPTHPAVRSEADNGLKNLRGSIAMVRQRDDIHSATSQFFINVADNPDLDYKERTPDGYGYCVFGKVIDGIDVVDAINKVEVVDKRDSPEFERTPKEQIVIKSIRELH